MTNTTTIVNKRGFDPDDTDRLARRRHVREAAARRDAELLPAALAEQDIRTSEARCDEAADQHAVATAPLQQELDELERVAICRIGERQPADSAADERRGELLALISEANAQLESTVGKEREIQSVLRRKSRLARQGHPPSDTILSALGRPPAASPRLLADLHVTRERIRWLRARQQAAEKTLKIHVYNTAEIRAGRMNGDLAIFLAKVAAWEAERDAASQELAEAMAASAKAHQAMIDE